jgi:hypothetical protein
MLAGIGIIKGRPFKPDERKGNSRPCRENGFQIVACRGDLMESFEGFWAAAGSRAKQVRMFTLLE